jgi:amidohydrolase
VLNLKQTIEKLTPKLMGVFTHLHNNPEISWEEYETTNYINELFKDLPCKITPFKHTTGLMIEIGSGKPVIGLRADIDALYQEVDGTFQANHSCGHDAHMSIVIGTLYTLLEEGYPDKGTFRFIFQPAEEKGNGALALVEEGIVDDVDFLYGMHVRPIQELRYQQFAPAIQHGAARFIEGKIRGNDAHGARPHLNVNAIQVGSELVQHISNINIDPMIPYSIKMTAFQAGGKSANIIPGSATFSIDMRAQTNEAMEVLMNKLEGISESIASLHGVEIDLEIGANVAAAVINEEASAVMREAIIECKGEEKLVPMITTTGGDDFHFYTIKRPHIKATMLAIGCDVQPGLHHPKMTFNHDIIPHVVEILTKALIKTAEKHS